MIYFRYLMLFFLAIFLQGSLGLNASDDTLSKQEKVEQLILEMGSKQKEILDLLREGELLDNVSSYEKIFKTNVPNVRCAAVSILMSRISEDKVDVGSDEEIAELLKTIIESRDSYPEYKIWLAEIFFVKKPIGFNEPEQSLSNETFLYATVSEELKNQYITQQVSMIRYLYVNRWVNRKFKESKLGNSEANETGADAKSKDP